MASESREDSGVAVDVSAELHEWLDERASVLGVGREELVVQILSSYRAAATLDGELDAANVLDLSADDFVDVENAVDDAVHDSADEAAESAVENLAADRVEDAIDDALADRVEALVADRLDVVDAEHEAAIADLDAAFQRKIEDVRERVIQVKQEADAKAAADHSHEEFSRLETIHERVSDLAGDLADLQDGLDDQLQDHEAAIDDVESNAAAFDERLDDVESKLNRVAWVVSDLKDDGSGRDAHDEAVDRIKRAAAQEGISTADCEQCGESVDVALLTDPECPHCNATVSDVRPVGGIFRTKARLVAASQLESGEAGDDA